MSKTRFWTRFVLKRSASKENNDWSMVIIEGHEDIAVPAFKFMFKNSDDYYLHYSTPPTIENVDFYVLDTDPPTTVRVFTADDLKELSPTTSHKVF